MKRFTLEELKNSPNTMTKFFIEKGDATLKDIDEGREFYKLNSKGKYKEKNLKPSAFKKMYKKQLDVYNNKLNK